MLKGVSQEGWLSAVVQALQSLANHGGFWWREKASPLVALANTRPYVEQATDQTAIAAHKLTPLATVEQTLLKDSKPLQHCQHYADVGRYAECMAIAHQLSVMFDQVDAANKGLLHKLFDHKDSELRWLDIGAKNWAYVEALAHHAQQLAAVQDKAVTLTGVELDANRLYANGTTRGQVARGLASAVETHLAVKAAYIHGDIANHAPPKGGYNVISWLLPFVVAEPCLYWGLPLTQFKPARLWQHTVQQLLADGALLLLINQGEAEAEAQRQLIQTTPEITIVWEGWLPDQTFIPYDIPRYGWVCQKQDK